MSPIEPRYRPLTGRRLLGLVLVVLTAGAVPAFARPPAASGVAPRPAAKDDDTPPPAPALPSKPSPARESIRRVSPPQPQPAPAPMPIVIAPPPPAPAPAPPATRYRRAAWRPGRGLSAEDLEGAWNVAMTVNYSTCDDIPVGQRFDQDWLVDARGGRLLVDSDNNGPTNDRYSGQLYDGNRVWLAHRDSRADVGVELRVADDALIGRRVVARASRCAIIYDLVMTPERR